MDGFDPYWTDEMIGWMKEQGIYAETDWQKVIYNNFGFQQQHNISATGGTNKLKHFTSIGFFDQDGILKNTDYQRINIRSNIEAKIADGLSLGAESSGLQYRGGVRVQPYHGSLLCLAYIGHRV